MDIILKIIALTTGSAVTLYILTRLMGNKEMSQLTMFDYIIGITIGSIAAEMSTALEDDFMQPLVAMIIYAIISIAISVFSCHSLRFRRFIYGNSLILYDNDEIYVKNLKKAKIDINEFLMQCRVNGFFNLNNLKTAILEINGKISFLPKENQRPVTPLDLNISPSTEKICITVILDGVLLKKNLQYSGNDEIWLQKQLVSQNVKDMKDVFLAICDAQNNLIVYLKNEKENKNDFFQ
ncbi:MAG: DUF421 domain-containing protein [Clostridia bacterium]|nr:DUF421 domain-containing protein [Clostridia bacterium]